MWFFVVLFGLFILGLMFSKIFRGLVYYVFMVGSLATLMIVGLHELIIHAV